jgi:uncharacterized protein
MDNSLPTILVLPLLAGFISQFAKYLIKSNNYKLDWRNMMSYSGMPSSHAAIVVSLASIVGLEAGIGSPLFSISLIQAVIVIRDALGIRRYLEQHSKVINIMVKELKDDRILEEKYPHLLEKIGHTPSQVIAGALLGFMVSLVGYLVLHQGGQ